MPTTFGTIRNRVKAVLEATAPSTLPGYPFRYVPSPEWTIREWADSNPTDACVRHFDIRRVGASTENNLAHPDEVQRTEELEITVSYSRTHGLYGQNGLDDMEDVIRADARTIRDLLASGSTWGAVTDWSGVTAITIAEPERGDEGEPWFQVITATIIYCEAATYSA